MANVLCALLSVLELLVSCFRLPITLSPFLPILESSPLQIAFPYNLEDKDLCILRQGILADAEAVCI